MAGNRVVAVAGTHGTLSGADCLSRRLDGTRAEGRAPVPDRRHVNRAYSGRGKSELKMSAAINQEPSACRRRITMYLPLSGTGSDIPSIIKVSE